MSIKKRFISTLLCVAIIMSLCVPFASAASLQDGAAWVKVSLKEETDYLRWTNGASVKGDTWSYVSDTGVSGAAFCVNWGLNAAGSNKQLTITGRYSDPKVQGAMANGYPARSVADFLAINSSVSELAGLTESELEYATQIAVWAATGKLAVEGTSFTSGSMTVRSSTQSAQEARVYGAVKIILQNASSWTRQLDIGMYVRAEHDALGNTVDLSNEYDTLELAALDTDRSGVKKESIGGTEYYTREYTLASATSTFPSGYKIYVWAENAPSGTVFADLSGNVLPTGTYDGKSVYLATADTDTTTTLNTNGFEYAARIKICIPVPAATAAAEVKIHCAATASQYYIYEAYNDTAGDQSYIVADPSTTNISTYGYLIWGEKTGDETGDLQITKTDGTGNPLEGATFRVNGESKTTGADGIVLFESLSPGSVTISETSAPEGYSTVADRAATITAGATTYVTVRNYDEAVLRIKKIDRQNGATLGGATFKFEQIDGSFTTTITTGTGGLAELTQDTLPYGAYKVYEIATVEGYELDSTPQTVDWNGSADVELTFTNVRKPGITLIKTNESGKSLPGAVFEVFKDGQLITTVTTNSAGIATVSGLSEGYFEFIETTAPAGYELDSTRHGIYLDPYNPQSADDPVLIVTNKAKPSLRILKHDYDSKAPIEGVTFEVYHDASLYGVYTTDVNGEILLSGLPSGTYLVKEVASSAEYVVNSTPQQIEITAGQTEPAQLMFFNKLKPGMWIIKVDSETLEPLPIAVYQIKMVGGSYDKEFTTNQNGEIDLSTLEPGAYQVIEKKAPSDSYLIDDGIRTIQLNAGENAQFVFTNTRKPSLEIIKYDPVAEKHLPGATFRIARIEDGSHYLDRITDINGKIVIDDLEPGVYSVLETAAPSSYVLNSTEYHMELFPGKTSTLVVNNEKKPNLQIIKTDAVTGEPVAGVTFTINKVDSSTLMTLTTDSDGQIFMEALDPGVYSIRETSVPDDYLLSETEPKLITLVPNETGVVQFRNYQKPTLTINKIDSVTGDPIKGAKFSVTYSSNNTSTGTINDLGVYYSDENGKIMLTKLTDGWYTVAELEPASGYAMKEPITQTVYVEAGRSKTVTFENTPLNAIVIKKVDADTGEVLQGAKFELRYLSGVSGTGGTIIGSYTTSSNGTITITGLKAGTYIISETQAPDGYEITEAAKTIYLTENEQTTVSVEFADKKMSGLIINKYDSSTNQPLAGATFKVTDSSGAVVGTGNGTYTTDASGQIHITELPVGSYVVTETKAPDGYIIDSNSQTISIKSAGSTYTLNFYNTAESGLLIQKYDSVTNKPLAGAKFNITNSSVTVVGNSKGIFTTDTNGQILLTELEPTTYIITEISAPNGYVLDETSHTIEVKGDNKLYTIDIYNTP